MSEPKSVTTPTQITMIIDWMESEAFYQAGHDRQHAADKLRRAITIIEDLWEGLDHG